MKNIYELLNDVETDFLEYEIVELSMNDKQKAKDQVLKEARNMKTGFNKNKNIRKQIAKAAAIVCAFVVTVGGGTALASGVFSDTIDKMVGTVKGTKDEQTLTDKYTVIGEKTSAVQTAGDSSAAVTEVTDAGVTITMKDIYCDGYQLYYTAVLTSDDAKLNESDYILIGSDALTNSTSVNGIIADCGMGFRRAEDGTFVLFGETSLGYMKLNQELKIADGEALDFRIVIDELCGYDADNHDSSGEYMTTAAVSGDWKLKFPVTVDTSDNMEYVLNQEVNGVKLLKAIVTKTGLTLEFETPDFTQAPYNDPYNDPDIFLVDGEGNDIQWLMGFSPENEDGSRTHEITFLYQGEKELKLCLTNKNVDDEVIAEIDFQIP